ncbi:MAG: hypothetical protein Roseis3KO_17870 [Roseivirga sp.]
MRDMKAKIMLYAGLLIVLVTSVLSVRGSQDIQEQDKAKQGEKYEIELTEQEWKERLTKEQFEILRKQATERAFTGKYDKFFEKGTYYSAASLEPVFSSETKYNSGSGCLRFMPLLRKER